MAVYNGTSASDYYSGGSSADVIYGNGGADYLYGNGGDDSVYGGAGNDSTFGGDGNDLLDDYTASSFGGNDTMEGGAGNDTLRGYDGNDSLLGGDDADLLEGESGYDTLNGGAGADSMYGGAGGDTYFIDNVGDVVSDVEDYGYDVVYAGVDATLGSFIETLYLTGRSGISGTGNDLTNSIYGNEAGNTIVGLGGGDYVRGGLGADTIDGGADDDNLYGEDGNDSLVGGSGNDILDGGTGVDTIVGGSGDDTYYVTAGDIVSEAAGGGTDTVYTQFAMTLASEFENAMLGAAVTVYGNTGANRLVANGYDGALYGLGGNDTLDADWGNATLTGGAGDDLYRVRAFRDPSVVEAVGEGTDTLNVTFSAYYSEDTYIVAANIENVVITDQPYSWSYYEYYLTSHVVGNASNNSIEGGEADNGLAGGAGNDTLYGGNGNDTLDGGAGTDRFDGGAGSDRVDYSTNTVAVKVDLVAGSASFIGQTWAPEALVSMEEAVGGSGNDVFVGNGAANVFYGNTGNDTFTGGAGSDSLYGGDGNDTFDGGGGTDYVDGGAGSDLLVYSTITTSVSADLAAGVVTFPGQTWAAEYFWLIESIVTGSAADTLIGSTAANTLRGAGAADRLTGAGGADQLVGGAAGDTFVFVAVSDSIGASRDTIAAGDGAIAFDGAGAAAGDRIDLSAIDANTTVAGNQAFLWGTATTKGHLWAVNSGTTTLIRGNTDADAAVEIEIAITDAAVLANKYVASDFVL